MVLKKLSLKCVLKLVSAHVLVRASLCAHMKDCVFQPFGLRPDESWTADRCNKGGKDGMKEILLILSILTPIPGVIFVPSEEP